MSDSPDKETRESEENSKREHEQRDEVRDEEKRDSKTGNREPEDGRSDSPQEVSNDSPEKLLVRIQFAERTDRFDEMVAYVIALVTAHPGYLEKQGELELVSVAFKNAIGERRSAWREVKSYMEEVGGKGNKETREVAEEYTEKLGKEITDICIDLRVLVDKHLLTAVTSAESKVLLHKLKGDYSRYQTEVQSGDDKTEASEEAQASYLEALEIGSKELIPSHPIMLGLVLNLSLYHCVTLSQVDIACEVAGKGMKNAEEKMADVPEGKRTESERLLRVIKDNVQAWKSDT